MKQTTLRELVSSIAGIIERKMPHTKDGKPIFLGDTVYLENPDREFFGEDEIISQQVSSISLNTPPTCYEGKFVITCEDWEGTENEVYSSREIARENSEWL